MKAGASKNATLDALLIPGEEWKLVSEGHRFTEGPAVNAKGEVFFTDGANSKIHKIGLDGKVTEFIADTKRASGQAFGPDGRLYAVTGEKKIVAYDVEKPGSPPAVIAEGVSGNDIVVARNGNIYVTEPNTPAADQSNVWLIKPNGEKKVVDTGTLLQRRHIVARPDAAIRR